MKIKPYSRIVVEGMDGSGKTILTNQLMFFLGPDGHHVPGYNRTPEPKLPMKQWWLEELGHARSRITVHDRFFYPELVYGPVLRGRADIDDTTRSYVQNFLRTRAMLIYCRPRVGSIEVSINVEEQMKGVKENLPKLLISYDAVMNEEAEYYGNRFFRYDWEQSGALMLLLRKVSEYIYE